MDGMTGNEKAGYPSTKKFVGVLNRENPLMLGKSRFGLVVSVFKFITFFPFCIDSLSLYMEQYLNNYNSGGLPSVTKLPVIDICISWSAL